MNPLLFLLGLLGTGAVAQFGRGSTSDTSFQSDGIYVGGDTDDGGSIGKSPSGGKTTPPPVTSTGDDAEDGAATGGGSSGGTTSGGSTTTGGQTTRDPEIGDATGTGFDSNSSGGSSGGSTSDGSTTSSNGTTPEGPANPSPTAPTQTGGTGADGGSAGTVAAQSSVNVYAGRVTTLEAQGGDIDSVRIVSDVQHGNVTVNPDNTIALVMTRSDFTGNQSFSYEVTHTNGATSVHQVNLNVQRGLQDDGWATGEYQYMLATDENDDIIVEAGDNHTKVYVSGSNQALSRADIAQMEGMSTSQVTGQWLANSAYGQSEGLALDEEAGMMLWREVTPANSTTSNWLLLERGYVYNDLDGRIFADNTSGEDENHPLLFGAWGEGSMPEMTDHFFQYGESSDNVVVQGIHFSDGLYVTRADNIIFDGVVATNAESVVGEVDGGTIRNSAFFDASEGVGDGKTQGLYMGWESHGVLLEGNFFDMNGWEQGYENGTGQAPTIFSHNLYLQHNLEDVVLRDSIIMRGASFGAQVRSGGFVEDNVFIDNNAQLSIRGGDYEGAGNVGYYSLVLDNLITSAGHKSFAPQGASSTGIHDTSAMTSYVDNIIAHLADPNGNETWKTINNGAQSQEETPFYDDTVVYNWAAYGDNWGNDVDRNVEGLNTGVLDQVTIQNFTAQLLGQQSATIDDLATYLRAQYTNEITGEIDADAIINFFQQGFGIAPDARTAATEITFVPNDLGDGVRWDNELNWDSGDLPGLYADDNVNLNGNEVVFGGNAEIGHLDLGPDGWLNVYGGRLEVNDGLSGNGDLNVEGAGQIWTDGSDGSDIDITVSGGRFANTGDFSGADLNVTGGDAILATGGATYEVSSGHTLSIKGGADAGFDGDNGGMAILDMDAGATLALGVEDGQLGSIAEFRSGAFGEGGPNVQSGIGLDGVLSIDLAGLSASAGSTIELMSADEIVGLFDEADVGGLGGRNANIVVNYETDTVTLELSSGNGAVSIETVGEQSNVTSGSEALWQALTADQGIVSENGSVGDEEQDDALLDAA